MGVNPDSFYNDKVKGLLRSIGDAGASPANVQGSTVLKYLDTVALGVYRKVVEIGASKNLEPPDAIGPGGVWFQSFTVPSGINWQMQWFALGLIPLEVIATSGTYDAEITLQGAYYAAIIYTASTPYNAPLEEIVNVSHFAVEPGAELVLWIYNNTNADSQLGVRFDLRLVERRQP